MSTPQSVHWKGRHGVVAPLAAGILLACAATSPGPERDPGGPLAPCPGRPNCVCSEDPRPDFAVAPLAVEGHPEVAWERLKRLLEAAGGRIEAQAPGYLHATFRSRIFRFVDDVEFRLDRARGAIHVRSASRLGYSDLGVNRRRVEDLRAQWTRP